MKKFNEYDEKVISLFGIQLFKWEDLLENTEDSTKYLDCIFEFNSMEQFNGKDCIFHKDGLLTILDENDNEIWEEFVCEIPEFNQQIKKSNINSQTFHKLNMEDFYMALSEMGEEKEKNIRSNYSEKDIKEMLIYKFTTNWVEDIQNFIECYL